MKAPKCKLCGKEHNGLCEDVDALVANKVSGVANTMANKEIVAPAASPEVANEDKAEKSPETDENTYKYRNREKRRAYMKRYMRELRAKKTGKGGGN